MCCHLFEKQCSRGGNEGQAGEPWSATQNSEMPGNVHRRPQFLVYFGSRSPNHSTKIAHRQNSKMPDNVDGRFVCFLFVQVSTHSSKSHVSWGIFCTWRLYTIPPSARACVYCIHLQVYLLGVGGLSGQCSIDCLLEGEGEDGGDPRIVRGAHLT